jgi:predicted ATPase with chaperone activity
MSDDWQALIRKGMVTQMTGAVATRRPAPTQVMEAPVREPEMELEPSPPVPRSVDETGLTAAYIIDLVLKMLSIRGNMLGSELCDAVKLPYQGVVQEVLTFLKEDRLCEIVGGQGLTEMTWTFRLSDKGMDAAEQALRRDGYVGPAPVSLDDYNRWAEVQKPDWSNLHEADIRNATSHLVLDDDTINRIGPAFASGRPVLVYGYAGNGKTVLAEALATCLPDTVFIPYAIEAGSQTIRLYDAAQHRVAPEPEPPEGVDPRLLKRDERWPRIKRPFIVTGGELTIGMLGLTFDPQYKCYIAPVQMKANGGLLLVDDFGRQQVSPKELLNRWIIPMEKCIDYHVLASGVQIKVPFTAMLIFSTNLSPTDLVDEAFLRRIRYKMMIRDPSEEQFREIFRRMCNLRRIPYNQAVLDYLIQKHYVATGRPFRATHPRDLLDQLLDISHYRSQDPALSEALIDQACNAYFVL